MKHYLLNHQPQKGLQAACAQQGQAPTCNARGKGHTPASPKTLTKVILVLLTMFLLPSAAWADYTYGSGEELSFDYDGSKRYFWSSNGTIWKASLSGDDPSWPAEDNTTNPVTVSPFTNFNALKLTLQSKLKGTLTGFALSGTVTSEAHVNIKVYRLTAKDATTGTEIGSIAITGGATPTYTYTATTTNDVTQEFNNEYIQLAFEHTGGDASSIAYDAITGITLTFSGTSYDLSVDDCRVTSNNATDILGDSKVSFSSNTLTLSNGAALNNINYSGSDELTISFSGDVSINCETSGSACIVAQEPSKLSFTSSSGSLILSGNSSTDVIKGFSDVDFGSLNLASTSAQGVYYDSSSKFMAGHGTNPSELIITTEKYYPIWIYDPSLSTTGYSHTQLNSDKLSVAVGNGTVSFDGEHTITISGASINSGSNTMIVVGPDMSELTVHLVGASTGTDATTILALWNTTQLTFTTTDGSNAGSLTAPAIVNWQGGSGQISCKNGLVYNAEANPKTISTTGVRIKIDGEPIELDDTGYITGTDNKAHFDKSTNTLTLTNATIGNLDSYSKLQVYVDNLIVKIDGDNKIWGSIQYEGLNQSSSSIKIEKADGATNCLLEIDNNGSVINGFSILDFEDLNTSSSGPMKYDKLGPTEAFICLYNSITNEIISNVVFTTDTTYPLWITGIQVTQVTAENKTNILDDDFNSVSYNDNGVLTLKGTEICPSSDAIIVGDGISALTVHLVGYNKVGSDSYNAFRLLGENTTLKFTTSETLPGSLHYLGTLASGVSGDIDYKNGLVHNANGKEISATISNLDVSPFTGFVSEINEEGNKTFLYSNNKSWYASKAELHSSRYPFYVTVSPRSGISTSMWPGELSKPSLISKVLFQFDWGTNEGDGSNHSVTVQVKGLNDEKEYSSAIVLSPDADGIVEIPLTSQVTSENIQLVFSSTADFSFVPLSIGWELDYSNYLLVLNQTINTNSEEVQTISASQVSEGTITYNPSSKTLSLSNAVINANIILVETGIEGLNIELVGNNKILVDETQKPLLFKGFRESASITFSTNAETPGDLTISGFEEIFAFPGTDAISYVNLINYEYEGNFVIEYPSAPEIKGVMSEGDLAVEISKEYDDGDIYYTIDYAGETEDVSKAKYTNSFIMAAPGIVTAWVEVNDAETDEVIGKYFGYIDTPCTIAKGSTKEATIYPLITEDDFEIAYSSQEGSIATFANGIISGVATGSTQVIASLTPANDLEYTILNQLSMGVDQQSSSYILTMDVTVQELIDANTFTSGQNYGSFFNTTTETYKVPDGVVAYVITGVDGSSVTIAETKILPPDTPVLFYRTNLENATNYTFIQATASDGTFPEGNILEYAYEAVSADASSELYVLYKGKFVKVTSGTDIAAKHCYLNLGGVTAAGTRGFYYIEGGDDGTTAIREVRSGEAGSEKTADGGWHDLQGRKLTTKPAKGLYIRNGKKVVVK